MSWLLSSICCLNTFIELFVKFREFPLFPIAEDEGELSIEGQLYRLAIVVVGIPNCGFLGNHGGLDGVPPT
jgi:hypothetical protein